MEDVEAPLQGRTFATGSQNLRAVDLDRQIGQVVRLVIKFAETIIRFEEALKNV